MYSLWRRVGVIGVLGWEICLTRAGGGSRSIVMRCCRWDQCPTWRLYHLQRVSGDPFVPSWVIQEPYCAFASSFPLLPPPILPNSHIPARPPLFKFVNKYNVVYFIHSYFKVMKEKCELIFISSGHFMRCRGTRKDKKKKKTLHRRLIVRKTQQTHVSQRCVRLPAVTYMVDREPLPP